MLVSTVYTCPVTIPNNLADTKDRKQAVRWLCDYIKMQATKEQLHHSKDLHTMIVAAFNTILVWIKERPSLLASKVWTAIEINNHGIACNIAAA